MLEALKPLIMSLVTALITAVATHYHFTSEQTQQFTVDVFGALGVAGSAAAATLLHMKAYWATPPKGAGK